MGIGRILISTAVLGLAISVVQTSPAQPKRRPLPGAPGAERPLPGAPGGPGRKAGPDGKKGRPDDPGAHGRRVAELKQKESAGTLTDEEKAELEQLKQQRHKGPRRAAREARAAELKEKEASGKLSKEEKQELEQIQRVQERHAKLKQKHEARKQGRKARRRAARRKALAEFPGLHKDQAAVAEYGKHGMRMAKLERAREVAEAEGLDELVARIDALLDKERKRHEQWVAKHNQGGK